jgi:hypothetical protein
MSLISLILAILCLAVTVIAWLDARHRQRMLAELRVDIARQRVDREERARFLRSREAVADGGDLATTVVDMPTAITRFGHDTIAGIPFTVLESIPATAETSKVVRELHDEISHAVYDAISGTTRGIAGFVRRGLTGGPSPRKASAPPAASAAPGEPAAPEQRRPRPRPSASAAPDATDSPDSPQP